ncbi:MAG: hypothetical protein J6R99_03760 [Alphaproteobacteria bacterium]|nr:hypothetical protein [Alphaproteobacteria bacterium]
MEVVKYVSGYTVKMALQHACDIATKKQETVLTEINDIMMRVEKNDSPDALLEEYKQKLNFKYEIENIKRQKQK